MGRTVAERGTDTAILAAGGVLFAASQTMIVPLLPSIAATTHAGIAELSWLVTGPLVVAASLAPTLGRLADLHGKKRVLLGILIAMTAGALLVGSTTYMPALIAGRCLQGLGGAFVPVAISLLKDTVTPGLFARGVALLSSSLGVGVALGVPLAAAVADATDWHIVFLTIAALTATTALVMWATVAEGRRSPADGFDVAGSIALTVLLAVVMLLITTAGQGGQPALVMIGGASAVIIGGWLWVWHELRITSPVVDLRLAARMPVALTNAIAFFLGYGLFANILVTTHVLQVPSTFSWGYGLSLLQTGLLIAPAGVTIIIFAQVSAMLAGRVGARTTMLLGTSVMVLGYVLHLTLPAIWGAVIALVVVSAGLALAYAALPVLVSAEVPANATASANAINVLLRTAGQASCSAVTAALLLAFTVGASAEPARLAYDLSFASAMAASAVAFAITLALPRRS